MRYRYHIKAKHGTPSKIDFIYAPMMGAITAVIVSTGVAAGSGYVFWSLVTGHLSPTAVGQTTALVAAFSVVSLFVGQPIGVTLVTLLPRSLHSRSLLKAALRMTAFRCLLISLAFILVLPHVAKNFAYVNHPLTIGLFVAAATTQSLGLVSDQASIGIRYARVMSQRNTAQGLLKVGIFILLVTKAEAIRRGPDAVLGVWAAANVLSTSWSILSCLTHCPPETLTVSRTALRKELNDQSIWQNIACLCGSLPPQIMPLMVAGEIGARASGVFSLTWNVGSACYVISPAVASALLAELSDDGSDSRRRVRLASIITVGLLGPMDIVLVVFGSFLLHFFGKNVEATGYGLLLILIVATLPDAVTNIAATVYRSKGQIVQAAIMNAVIAVVVLSSISFFVGRQQVSGGGYAWLAGEVAGALALPLLQFGPRVLPTFQRNLRNTRSENPEYR